MPEIFLTNQKAEYRAFIQNSKEGCWVIKKKIYTRGT